MKVIYRAATLIIACILLLSFISAAFAEVNWKLVVKVKGTVENKKLNDDKWKPIFSSRPLSNDDLARALDQSEGKILLEGGNVVRFFENSIVEIAKVEANETSKLTQVKQTIGKIYCHVERIAGKKQRFEVHTPTAVLAVRGSDFVSLVLADGTTTCWPVIDPLEVTAAGKTIIINPGSSVTVTPDGIQTPQQDNSYGDFPPPADNAPQGQGAQGGIPSADQQLPPPPGGYNPQVLPSPGCDPPPHGTIQSPCGP